MRKINTVPCCRKSQINSHRPSGASLQVLLETPASSKGRIPPSPPKNTSRCLTCSLVYTYIHRRCAYCTSTGETWPHSSRLLHPVSLHTAPTDRVYSSFLIVWYVLSARQVSAVPRAVFLRSFPCFSRFVSILTFLVVWRIAVWWDMSWFFVLY